MEVRTPKERAGGAVSRSSSLKRMRAKSPASASRGPKQEEKPHDKKVVGGAPSLSSLRRSTPWTFCGVQLDGLVGLIAPWLLHMTLGQVRVFLSSLLVLLLYTGWVTLQQPNISPFFFGSCFLLPFSVLCSLDAHAMHAGTHIWHLFLTPLCPVPSPTLSLSPPFLPPQCGHPQKPLPPPHPPQ